MDALNAAKIIRRVRHRLDLSQEGLSRLLNATKGAVQHWERGRNNPDLGRLLALRQLCPPAPERKELDALIKQTQAQVAPLYEGEQILPGIVRRGRLRKGSLSFGYPSEGLLLLRRENARFKRQIARFQATLQKRTVQLRILEDLVTDLQRELGKLRATQPAKTDASHSPASSEAS